MSNQKKTTKTSAVFAPFTGIDARNPHQGTARTANLVNFRLTKDGALVKREGFHRFAYLSEKIRAVWTGKLFGEVQTILLAGASVVRLQISTGATTVIGTLPSSTQTKLQFFFYRDRLYLLGDDRIYEINQSAVTPIEAYIPLIGKDWPTSAVGSIYQPRNLLTRRARIHYLAPASPSIFLRTAYAVESIQAVYVNDVLQPSSDYSYDNTTLSIILAGLKQGDRVRVHLTYAASSEESDAEDLLSCTRAEIFGETENNRIFLWNGTKKNTFYPSRYVSEEELNGSKLSVSSSVPLYFPEHTARVLGDGQHNVTGFVRQYDRLLIFTETEAYMTNAELLSADQFSARPINPMVGCSTIGACIVADNAPFTVSQGRLYCWTSDTDEYSQCNAYDISEPVRTAVEQYVFEYANLFFYQDKREIFLYSQQWADSLWIYQLDTHTWYRFSNIKADYFFEAKGKLFFCLGNYIYDFSEQYYEDIHSASETKEIVAKFESHLLEYGTCEQKHFSRLTLRADSDGGVVKIQLFGNGIATIQRILYTDDPHSNLSYRLWSGRFQHATIAITAGGVARQTIHSLISDVR